MLAMREEITELAGKLKAMELFRPLIRVRSLNVPPYYGSYTQLSLNHSQLFLNQATTVPFINVTI